MSKKQRLYFIDALRAFAIIMMMQGHFVDTLLDPAYRDSGVIYSVWAFFRGITAPTFFTISGFVFIYLLLKTTDPEAHYARVKKGVKRGVLLIIIGYILRIPILSWLTGTWSDALFKVDVLHCIGLSLIGLIGLYYASFKKRWLLAIVALAVWLGLFLTEPLYREARFEEWPVFIRYYLTKSGGSIFTIIPWFGFASFGGFMAAIFNIAQDKKHFKSVSIAVMLVIATFLSQYSSWFLNFIYLKTEVLLFKNVAYFNYLFQRQGHVLFLFAFFYALNNAFKAQWILKVGQKTLSIYVVHFIVLYGSFTGLGLWQVLSATLTPWAAAIGALLFVIGVSMLSIHDFKSNKFFYARWKKLLDRIKNKLAQKGWN
jgi:uncharacterized membrane protein